MTPTEHQLYSREGAGSSDPIGWTLAMGLCNLLIALVLLAFVTIVAIELRAFELF